MRFPVFDLHCDTAYAMLGKTFDQVGDLRSNAMHIDLERASKLPGYCQCFACFTTPYMQQRANISPVVVFERELASIQRELDKNKDLMKLAYSPKQIRENLAQGMMSAVLTIEGPAGFGFDPALLEDLYKIGFRITSLGWNESNPLTGSHKTGGGLTDLGREFVREAQRLGMLVDVRHISDEGFWDIMDITQAPVIASHSNSRKICGVSRNLTDEMFLEICKTGGVVGFNQCDEFVGTDPDMDMICDHILHFLDLDPNGKHIALGGDLDGCDILPKGFDGVQSYPDMADRLLARGVGEDTVMDIFWNNALGVMDIALCDHKR